MAFISQRNTGSVWDKRARYIEQSTSALQRYVKLGDEYARHTKMQRYTPKQAQEADTSLYERLLKDEQTVKPGRMPERSSGTAMTSVTTGWGPRHLAISGVSHQPYIQTAHHTGHRPYTPENEVMVPLMEHAPLQNAFVGHVYPEASSSTSKSSPSRGNENNIDSDVPEDTPMKPSSAAMIQNVWASHTTPAHKGMDPYAAGKASISRMPLDMIDGPSSSPLQGKAPMSAPPTSMIVGPRYSPIGSLRERFSSQKKERPNRELFLDPNYSEAKIRFWKNNPMDFEPIPGDASGSGLQTVADSFEFVQQQQQMDESGLKFLQHSEAQAKIRAQNDASENERKTQEFEQEKKLFGFDDNVDVKKFEEIGDYFDVYTGSLKAHIDSRRLMTRSAIKTEQERGKGTQEEAALRIKKNAHKDFLPIYNKRNKALMTYLKTKHPKTYNYYRDRMIASMV